MKTKGMQKLDTKIRHQFRHYNTPETRILPYKNPCKKPRPDRFKLKG